MLFACEPGTANKSVWAAGLSGAPAELMVSLLMEKSISLHEWPTNILIWMSISMLGLESVRYAVEHWRTLMHQESLKRVKP